MNPSNDSSSADEKLDEALRLTALAPLSDHGFTDRVLLALPPATARSTAIPRRLVLCVLGAMAGVAFAWRQSGYTPQTLVDDSANFTRSLANASSVLGGPELWIAIVVTAASLVFAIKVRSPRRRRFV